MEVPEIEVRAARSQMAAFNPRKMNLWIGIRATTLVESAQQAPGAAQCGGAQTCSPPRLGQRLKLQVRLTRYFHAGSEQEMSSTLDLFHPPEIQRVTLLQVVWVTPARSHGRTAKKADTVESL